MADPATMMMVSAGLSAFQGLQAFQQGRRDARAIGRAAEKNALNRINQANETLNDTFRQNEMWLYRSRELEGATVTAAAASGLNLDGAPMMAFQRNMAQIELDRRDAMTSGFRRAHGYHMDAEAIIREGRINASNAYSAGVNALTGSLIQGGESLGMAQMMRPPAAPTQ